MVSINTLTVWQLYTEIKYGIKRGSHDGRRGWWEVVRGGGIREGRGGKVRREQERWERRWWERGRGGSERERRELEREQGLAVLCDWETQPSSQICNSIRRLVYDTCTTGIDRGKDNQRWDMVDLYLMDRRGMKKIQELQGLCYLCRWLAERQRRVLMKKW